MNSPSNSHPTNFLSVLTAATPVVEPPKKELNTWSSFLDLRQRLQQALVQALPHLLVGIAEPVADAPAPLRLFGDAKVASLEQQQDVEGFVQLVLAPPPASLVQRLDQGGKPLRA